MAMNENGFFGSITQRAGHTILRVLFPVAALSACELPPSNVQIALTELDAKASQYKTLSNRYMWECKGRGYENLPDGGQQAGRCYGEAAQRAMTQAGLVSSGTLPLSAAVIGDRYDRGEISDPEAALALHNLFSAEVEASMMTVYERAAQADEQQRRAAQQTVDALNGLAALYQPAPAPAYGGQIYCHSQTSKYWGTSTNCQAY